MTLYVLAIKWFFLFSHEYVVLISAQQTRHLDILVYEQLPEVFQPSYAAGDVTKCGDIGTSISRNETLTVQCENGGIWGRFLVLIHNDDSQTPLGLNEVTVNDCK